MVIMSSDSRVIGGHEGTLAEFVSLRQEIDRRTVVQNNLVTLQLTLSGAVFGFTLTDHSHIALLLALPFSTCILLGRYATQHAGIADIGVYIRESLSGKIPGGLGWENWILKRKMPKLPAVSLFEPLLVLFPGIAFLSLAWVASSLFSAVWSNTSFASVGLIIMWVLGLAASIVAVRLIWHTRRRWWLHAWRERRAR